MFSTMSSAVNCTKRWRSREGYSSVEQYFRRYISKSDMIWSFLSQVSHVPGVSGGNSINLLEHIVASWITCENDMSCVKSWRLEEGAYLPASWLTSNGFLWKSLRVIMGLVPRSIEVCESSMPIQYQRRIFKSSPTETVSPGSVRGRPRAFPALMANASNDQDKAYCWQTLSPICQIISMSLSFTSRF